MEALLEKISEAPADHYRRLNISNLGPDELLELSTLMKLSLSKERIRQLKDRALQRLRSGAMNRRLEAHLN